MNLRRTTTLAITCAALVAGATAPAVAVAPAHRPSAHFAGQRWPAPPLATKAMSSVDAARLDRAVQKAIDGSYEGTSGAWVGVWSPTKGMRVHAYGDAVKGGRRAQIGDHNFMGSVTKTVTATAVLEQVARGTLKLTDTVEGVDPALAAQFPPIAGLTVEQLLGMRSGLPDYANEPAGVLKLITADPQRRFTPRELIAIGLASNTIQPPGTAGYSTTNYIILGELLAKVTGRTPAAAINAVFRQAGMTQSALPGPGTTAPQPRSHGYIGNASAGELVDLGAIGDLSGTDVTSWDLSWGRAGGGAYTTVEDLGRWGALGLGTALLPTDLGDRRIAAAKKSAIGYGWGLFADNKGWISHTGQVLGWEASVKQNTRTGEVVVVMVNSTSGLSDVTTAVNDFLQD